jgi:hypothetical protein
MLILGITIKVHLPDSIFINYSLSRTLDTTTMKPILFPSLSLLVITTIAFPRQAQALPEVITSENCSNFCLKLDVQSGLINNLDLNNSNNLRWQLSLIWQPNSPVAMQAEAQKARQKLEDIKTSMMELVEAISQNNMARANGLSILLAPKLGYTNPKQLIADIQAKAIPLSQTPQKSTYRYMIPHHEMHTA